MINAMTIIIIILILFFELNSAICISRVTLTLELVLMDIFSSGVLKDIASHQKHSS